MNQFVFDIQSRPVPSLGEILEQVKESVEYEAFDKADKDSALDLCKIITEIFLFAGGSKLKIDGELIDIEVIRQVFAELRHEHLEIVLQNYNASSTMIRNKKAYLRTALYNSYFEETVYWTNLVHHDSKR